MAILTKAQILELEKPKTKVVHVPVWNNEVIIRKLTAGDALKLQKIQAEDGKPTNEYYFTLLSMVIVDESLQPMFTSAEIESFGLDSLNSLLETVLTMNGATVDPVIEATEQLKNL